MKTTIVYKKIDELTMAKWHSIFSLVMLSNFLTLVYSGCSSENNTIQEGGICISFDDRYINEWHELRPLFDKYDVKVTFFISSFDSLTSEEIQKLHDLASDGHEIGSHGALHVISEIYIKKHSYNEYLENEIIHNKEGMQRKGFDPISFAYPYGAKYWFTDFLISRHHNALRSDVAVNKERDLSLMNEIYYDFDGNNEFYSMGFDTIYNLTPQMIYKAIQRAKDKNEVLIMHGHVPDQGNKYSFSTETLTYILEEAKRQNLKFYTFKELAD